MVENQSPQTKKNELNKNKYTLKYARYLSKQTYWLILYQHINVEDINALLQNNEVQLSKTALHE